MKRAGPVHHYESFAYLLITACKTWHRGDEHIAHFTTDWDTVTCKRCLEQKPKSKRELEELEKLRSSGL